MISRRIARELSNREFRDTYKRARVRSKLVYQIRALRKQRGWLQGKLAELMRKPQSVISRIEDPDYGKVSLETLFEISDAFDLGLVVEFVSYTEFLAHTSDLSEAVLQAPSFSERALLFLTNPPSSGTHSVTTTEVLSANTVNVSGDATIITGPLSTSVYNTEVKLGVP